MPTIGQISESLTPPRKTLCDTVLVFSESSAQVLLRVRNPPWSRFAGFRTSEVNDGGLDHNGLIVMTLYVRIRPNLCSHLAVSWLF